MKTIIEKIEEYHPDCIDDDKWVAAITIDQYEKLYKVAKKTKQY
jgi:hypothetical protein